MVEPKIGIIIQARMTSQRLPGKVLFELSGKPLLWHIVKRSIKIVGEENVFIATSTLSEDNEIYSFAQKNNFRVFRGDLNNVLSRYWLCAKENKFDVIIRVTGDNPIIDIDVYKKALKNFLKEHTDYLKTLGYPLGTNVEIFGFDALERVVKLKELNEIYKEHVSLYFYKNPDKFKVRYLKEEGVFNEINFLRLTVDYMEDYEVMKYIFSRLYEKNIFFGLHEILALYQENREKFLINLNKEQKTV